MALLLSRLLVIKAAIGHFDHQKFLIANMPRRPIAVMSGRRPLIKGFLGDLRTSRVRSCLRPVCAERYPPALMIRPLGSLPRSPDRALIARLRFRLPSRFRWFTSPLSHPRFRVASRRKSLPSPFLPQAATGLSSYSPPRASRAKMMRANLLARATATSLNLYLTVLRVSN
jgi:hypothetical protein